MQTRKNSTSFIKLNTNSVSDYQFLTQKCKKIYMSYQTKTGQRMQIEWNKNNEKNQKNKKQRQTNLRLTHHIYS